MEWEWELHRPSPEFGHHLCNWVGGECGASHTLVFLPVLFWQQKENKKTSVKNISNNNIVIQLSKWEAHYMIVIQSDWNGKLKKIKMRLII